VREEGGASVAYLTNFSSKTGTPRVTGVQVVADGRALTMSTTTATTVN